MAAKVIDRGMDGILAQLKQLHGASITVGVHEGAGDPEGGISTAEVGAIQEYGSRDGRVSARPWLSTTIDENETELMQLSEKVVDRVLKGGGKVPLRLGLEIVGERAVQLVQAKLRDSDPSWVPLAKVTKEAKARRAGLHGEAATAFVAGDGNPLVDTSQLLNSIASKVEVKGAP